MHKRHCDSIMGNKTVSQCSVIVFCSAKFFPRPYLGVRDAHSLRVDGALVAVARELDAGNEACFEAREHHVTRVRGAPEGALVRQDFFWEQDTKFRSSGGSTGLDDKVLLRQEIPNLRWNQDQIGAPILSETRNWASGVGLGK